MPYHDTRVKDVLKLLGPVRVARRYFYDPQCHAGRCPKDTWLDVEGTAFSPGVRRAIARVSAWRPFGLGAEDLEELAGIHVPHKQIERIGEAVGSEVETFLRGNDAPQDIVPVSTLYVEMDGTGVPMVKREVEGRTGKQPTGEAKTREVKLGCDFTQTHVDEDGAPIRDENSTTSCGAITSAESFGTMIEQEAHRRRLDRAARVVVLGDGAQWIWNLVGDRFHSATQIVDLYHAKEHCWEVARAFFPRRPRRMKQWVHRRCDELDRGDVHKVIRAIGRLRTHSADLRDLQRREAGYFENNRARMRYKHFKAQGFFRGVRRYRGGMPHDRCPETQTIRHALECARCQRHHCPPMLHPGQPLGRLLG